jgi:hypothetical protein
VQNKNQADSQQQKQGWFEFLPKIPITLLRHSLCRWCLQLQLCPQVQASALKGTHIQHLTQSNFSSTQH